MTGEPGGLLGRALALMARPCPGQADAHIVLDVTDDEARRLGREPGRPLHVDRSRQPETGDLVWAEIVRRGSTQRLVRRYAHEAGWVTLSLPDDTAPAIMRRQSELLILGVIDDAPCVDVPAAGTDTAR